MFFPTLLIFRYHLPLNMELDLQSLFGLHVNSCTLYLRPRNLPQPPSFGLIYEGAIGQLDRRHLFVTPCCSGLPNIFFTIRITAQIKRKLCLQNLIIISFTYLHPVGRQNFFVTMTLKQNMTFEQDNLLAFNRDPDLCHEKRKKNQGSTFFQRNILCFLSP